MNKIWKAQPGDFIRTELGPMQVVAVDGVGGYELWTGGYVLDSELDDADILPQARQAA